MEHALQSEIDYLIRPVEPRDNPQLRELIVAVVKEFGCDDSDYLKDSSELRHISSQYQESGSVYWVIEDQDTGRVIGGGGYGRLQGTAEAAGICEVQKMYFLPECRGKGFGRSLLKRISLEAKLLGYSKLYVETHPNLHDAIALYERFGFRKIPQRLGDTGHDVCSVFMLYALS